MARELIKMVSTGKSEAGRSTGYFLIRNKNKSRTPDKRTQNYFDPRAYDEKTKKCGMHVPFKEEKVK